MYTRTTTASRRAERVARENWVSKNAFVELPVGGGQRFRGNTYTNPKRKELKEERRARRAAKRAVP